LTDRRDTCISFGIAAERYIEKGWAREVSKDQVMMALKKSSEEGLIHQISNAKKVDFICSCCECCCEAIKLLKKFPFPGLIVNSNYYAQINSESCTRCGTCIERCQMDAITLKKNNASIKKKKCIGCGNCVSTCPSRAIILVRKKKLKDEPPANGEILYQEILKLKK
jgi:NAD-dependent dihydropyrimidine dehydrogenase PreA subunit